jgi:uracil-DNA glycosylase family 4
MSKKKEIEKLSSLVENCKKCILHKTRNKPVLDKGSLDAKLMLIGEAPGYNEDKKGLPFVGKAGKILDGLLESINFKRSDVFVANILICRPPKNRSPLKKEIEMCKRYLNMQIEIIKPRIIAPMGNFATTFILKKFGLEKDKISNIHGYIYEIPIKSDIIKIIPLYHPAVVAYNINTKKTLIEDFKIIKKALNEF